MGYTHGQHWTNEKIAEEIRNVVAYYGISRMPSFSEIRECTGNHSLTNAIARSLGVVGWSKKLNLPIKQSETMLGIDNENRVAEIIRDMGYKVKTTTTKFPYDLLVEDCLKIDVKAARISKVRESDVYSFGLAKNMPTCDLYIAVCLDSEKNPVKRYTIPASVMTGKTQLVIGTVKTSYDKYKERWNLIPEYISAFKNIERRCFNEF